MNKYILTFLIFILSASSVLAGTTSTGNLGIGTVNPRQKVDVVGNGLFSGSLTAASFSGDGSGLTGISGGSGVGIGTTNTVAYWNSTSTIGSLNTSTYPSLTELSYVKDVTSAIQTQLNAKDAVTTAGDFITRTANDFDVDALDEDNMASDSAVHLATQQSIKAYVDTAISGVSGGAGGWTDGGTNVYLTATTDTVGIGTTTPSTTLEIVKQSSTSPLMVSSTATGDGDYLIVRSSGNVGIGTVVPIHTLAIRGAVSNNFSITSTSASGSGTGAGIQASVDDGAAVVLGDRLAFYTFGGSADTGDTIANGGAITGYADGTWTASSAPTEVRIEVAPSGSTTRAVALVADSTSNIGIGTTTPQQKLQVVGTVLATTFSGAGTSLTGTAASLTAGNVTTNANLTGDVTSSGNATTLSSTYKGWTDGGTNVYTTATTDAVAIGTTTPVSGAILTVNGTMAGSGSGPMAITNANVGIGTTTAGSLLTVGSTGQFTVDTSGNTRVGIGTTTAGTIVCVKSISGSTAQLGYCTGSLTNSICGTCN